MKVSTALLVPLAHFAPCVLSDLPQDRGTCCLSRLAIRHQVGLWHVLTWSTPSPLTQSPSSQTPSMSVFRLCGALPPIDLSWCSLLVFGICHRAVGWTGASAKNTYHRWSTCHIMRAPRVRAQMAHRGRRARAQAVSWAVLIGLADDSYATSSKDIGGSMLHHSRAQWTRSHKDTCHSLK